MYRNKRICPNWIICYFICCIAAFQKGLASSKCSTPPSFHNGAITSKWDGYALQFDCNEDYQLHGSPTLLCRNGRWNHPIPTCTPSDSTSFNKLKSHASSQRYSVLRTLTDAEYQNKYELPSTQSAVTARLSMKSKRPLFSWETDANVSPKNKQHNPRLPTQSLNKALNAKQMTGNRLRRKKLKKQNVSAISTTSPDIMKNEHGNHHGNSWKPNIQTHEKLSAHNNNKCPYCRYLKMNYSEIDLAKLDMSCMLNDSSFLSAPQIPNGVIDVYRRRHNPEAPFNNYLEAFYNCRKGFVFENSIAHSLYCIQNKWVGQLPQCINKTSIIPNKADLDVNDDDPDLGTKTSCKVNNGGCQHVCQEDEPYGDVICTCYNGYKLNDDEKTCIDINECEINNGNCQQKCWNVPASHVCYCSEGYSLGSDRKSCIDKNECLLNNGHGPCQDGCRNTEGGYECYCNIMGTQLATDNHTCEDIDECANDNFGCDHTCLNTIGSAFCACNDGYSLSEDWKSCEDVDECEFPDILEKCADGCINTVGSYTCAEEEIVTTKAPIEMAIKNVMQKKCEHGYELQGDHCNDINECAIDNYGCSHECNNVHGSAVCSCPNGYQLLEDWKTCEDINECIKGDGGCSQLCVNTEGSFHCQCHGSYILSADQKSCYVPFCMAPTELKSGVVVCNKEIEENHFYPVDTKCHVVCDTDTTLMGSSEIQCLMNGQWSSQEYQCEAPKLCPIMSHPVNGKVTPPSCVTHQKEEGELCYIECNEGYILKGNSRRICGPTQQWDPQESSECIQMIEEKVDLQCPNSVTMDLPENRKQMFIKLPHPSSNIDFRHLTVFPSWVANYQGQFPSGVTLITVKAVHPITGISKTCSFEVRVKDRFPPIVYNCPQPITNIVIDDDKETATVNWDEPYFVDNVGIVSVWKSREQGSQLPPGIHHIRYVARDAAGNTGHCGFSFQVIKVPKVDRSNPPMQLTYTQPLAPQNLYYSGAKNSCKELQKRHGELLHAFRMAIKHGYMKNSQNFLSAIQKGNVPPTVQLKLRKIMTDLDNNTNK